MRAFQKQCICFVEAITVARLAFLRFLLFNCLVMENLHPKELHERLDQLRNMNSLAESLVDISLKTAKIDIEVFGCELAELKLNEEFADILNRLDFENSPLVSINLSVTYDQIRQIFATSNIIFNFNKCYFEFSQTPLLRHQYGDCYNFQVVSDEKVILEKDKSFLLPSIKVGSMLGESGISLPQDPHPASWVEIEKILQFSNSWKTDAETTLMLDEKHTLFIKDSRIGGNTELRDEQFRREITIAEQFSEKAFEMPIAAAEFVFKSSTLNATPTIKSVSFMPLDFEPEFLGELPTIRKPNIDKRTNVELTNEILPDLHDEISSYYERIVLR